MTVDPRLLGPLVVWVPCAVARLCCQSRLAYTCDLQCTHTHAERTKATHTDRSAATHA